MGSPNGPNFDKESLKHDLARIAELRSQMEINTLKQHVATTGEAVIGVLADYQRQTLRALVAIGFSVCLFLLALNVHSWWGIALSAWIPISIYINTRLSKKDEKHIERVELLRCLARGADNFRRDMRLKLLRAFETGEFDALEQSEMKLESEFEDWEDDITDVLCPALRLQRYPGCVHSAKYKHFGPIYENLCDSLLERGGEGVPPSISLMEKSLREMHAACFGPNAAKDLGLEDYQQKP